MRQPLYLSAGIHQAAQNGLLFDDLRVVLDVGRRGRRLHQVEQVETSAYHLQAVASAEFVFQGD